MGVGNGESEGQSQGREEVREEVAGRLVRKMEQAGTRSEEEEGGGGEAGSGEWCWWFTGRASDRYSYHVRLKSLTKP
ncbi:hypothetical protein V5O48_013522 [Marasmius crinis-equi]|uniref:Uncharacterized protein n=1 Tax=Marasmius crinis-equi TaxID=585013 RepID=A0ABR3EZU3_9AGAR